MPYDHDALQRYACSHCQTERWLPEHPTEGPTTVQCGCEQCSRIVTHQAVGRDRRWEGVGDTGGGS